MNKLIEIKIDGKTPVSVACKKFDFGYQISISYPTERYRYESDYVAVGKDIIRFSIIDTYTDAICGKISVSNVNSRSVIYHMRNKETEFYLLVDNEKLLNYEYFVKESNYEGGQPS